MTLQEMQASEKDCLIARDIAEVIGISAEKIRDQAMKNPAMLGFPIIVVGSGIRIPRKAFLYWMEYGNAATTLRTANA